jgi:hypothetical protein
VQGVASDALPRPDLSIVLAAASNPQPELYAMLASAEGFESALELPSGCSGQPDECIAARSIDGSRLIPDSR